MSQGCIPWRDICRHLVLLLVHGGCVPASGMLAEGGRAGVPAGCPAAPPSPPLEPLRDTVIYSAVCTRLGNRIVAIKIYDRQRLASTKIRAIKREIAMMLYFMQHR